MSVDLVDLSRSLGVGPKGIDGEVGRNAPVRRTMERLVQFRLAAWQGDDRLGVLTKVPAVSRHHAERLCQPVQVTHERLLTDHLGAVVARAEGRELPVSTVRPPAEAPTAAPGPTLPGSDVAARLRAFGTNGHDPRSIVR